MSETIKKWKCPTCGKEISSMYDNQLNYNKKAHLLTHEGEDGD